MAFYHQKVISVVLLPQYIEWAHNIEDQGLKIGKQLNERKCLVIAYTLEKDTI
ncbi:hypothetical protein PLUTE_a3620 [Pseudoalteromonas luteoviolacea DSM 6061]|nr:hypothetical protein [Pseudoalteromonas luteoviolacea DSM 6061]